MSNKTAYLFSFFSGILFAVCWNGLLPAISLFFAFIPLIFVFSVEKWHYRQVFKFSLSTFLIFHLGTVWWLSLSSFWGAIIIILLNSMVMAAVIALAYRVRQNLGLMAGVVALIASWLAFEYVHYHWELSWPFMNLGNWLGQLPGWIQWYEYTGVLGGSLWVLLVNVLLYFTISKQVKHQWKNAVFFALVSLFVFTGPVFVSKAINKNLQFAGEKKTFLIVQPNIDPYTEKYDSSLFQEQITQQIEMAKVTDSVKIDCVVFPESSFPVYLNEEEIDGNGFVKAVENELLDKVGCSVFGGFYSYRLNVKDTLFYNTAFMINSGKQIQLYHKSKLVVGVEKMPFEKYFSFLKSWNVDFGGYTNSLGTDDERTVFTSENKGLRIAPVICYESVYGQFVTEFIKNGASFIAVITNDAWWGDTPGYKQHLMHSQLRAIETRRFVVRSANTGVSCYINAKGEVVSQIEPWTEGILIGSLPQNSELTFYTKYGDFIGVLAVFATLFLIIMAFFKNKKN